VTLSLYDATVPSYLQILNALPGLLDKAAEAAAIQGIDADEFIKASLAPDMKPFAFQITTSVDQSIGAIEGALGGSFSPAPDPGVLSLATLHNIVADAITRLNAIDAADVDSLIGQSVQLKVRDLVLNFMAEDFLLSFSQPNFYFHATTAYDILRSRGVLLTKRDFIGNMRVAS
jgi:hypothetical protein